jgi:hypothetical protein
MASAPGRAPCAGLSGGAGKFTESNLPSGPRSFVITADRVREVQPLLSLMRDIGGAHGGKTPGQVWSGSARLCCTVWTTAPFDRPAAWLFRAVCSVSLSVCRSACGSGVRPFTRTCAVGELSVCQSIRLSVRMPFARTCAVMSRVAVGILRMAAS